MSQPTSQQAAGSGAAANVDRGSVVLAEDDALLREGLAGLLTKAGFDVVAEAADADEMRSAVREHRPALLVADVQMPPENRDDGLRGAIELRREQPDLSVLVLSQFIEAPSMAELVGDDPRRVGYLLKQRVSKAAVLVDALDNIAAGGSVIDPEIINAMLNRQARRGGLSALTDRQCQVLALIAEGRSNAAIAEEMGLSFQTVKKHISAIMKALDLPPSDSEHRRVMVVLKYLESK